MNTYGVLALFLSCSICLSACGNYVAPPKGHLSELKKGEDLNQKDLNDLRTGTGEKFDPVADQVITTEALTAWRIAVAHQKQGDMTQKEWEEIRKSDEAESMRQLEDLSRRYPGSSYLKLMMGQVKHHFRKEKEAAGFYEEAMTRNRHDPLLTFKLANAKRDAGEKDEAIKYYREVIRIQPDFVDAKIALANCLLDQNAGSKEAKQLASEVASSSPKHPEGLKLTARTGGADKVEAE